MEYIKRFFGRLFKLRWNGLKTFSRLVLFQSDDEFKKRYKQERSQNFFVDYAKLNAQF